MRNFFNVFLSICFLLIITGCTEKPKPVEKKLLVHPNPTSYTFNMPINKLRDTLVKIFDIDHQMDNRTLEKIFYYKFPETGDVHINQAMFEPETADTAIFGKKYFKQTGTKDNIFLAMEDYWISPIYYAKGKPLEFTSSYIIEFKELGTDSTTITIRAFEPQIINGTTCCGPHGNYSIYQDVQPTTVEEYTLILYITQQLGIKGLKPLQLPK